MVVRRSSTMFELYGPYNSNIAIERNGMNGMTIYRY